VSVNEIAETVQHLLRPRHQVPVSYTDGRAADYEGAAVSNQRAKNLLNWSPGTPLAEGIRRYLDWLDTQRGGSE
jgi:UDP-glucose 4-epimerase